jgi:hypothetical protein
MERSSPGQFLHGLTEPDIQERRKKKAFQGSVGFHESAGRPAPAPVAGKPQRTPALTAAIWHNDHTGAPVRHPLTAYDP